MPRLLGLPVTVFSREIDGLGMCNFLEVIGTKKFALIAALLLILTTISGFIGYEAGKHHVIYSQELHVVEYYPADAQYDARIISVIDGEANSYDTTTW